MKIIKVTGKSIKEALYNVKKDYGDESVILKTKKVPKKNSILGLSKEFEYELTIALEDDLDIITPASGRTVIKPSISEANDNPLKNLANNIYKKTLKDEKKDVVNLSLSNEKKLSNSDVDELKRELSEIKGVVRKIAEDSYKDNMGLKHENIKKIYDIMTEADIDDSFSIKLLMKIEEKFANKIEDYNYLFRLVKKSIAIKLNCKSESFDNSKNLFFVGPTGVGKTTTIAKLASIMRLIQEKEVGIISIDTFRIAAVEQLKTFASISSIPFLAAYNSENLLDSLRRFKPFQKVFIDTAGRSPKNEEHIEDMINLLSKVKERFVILLMSSTTKLKDMLMIYEKFSKTRIDAVVFTKSDEASTLGDIFNFIQIVQKPFLFITNGQNVPDDILKIDENEFSEMIFNRVDI